MAEETKKTDAKKATASAKPAVKKTPVASKAASTKVKAAPKKTETKAKGKSTSAQTAPAKKATSSTKPASAKKSTQAPSKKAPAKKAASASSSSSSSSSATAKYVRVSPRKARLVVDKIRNKSVSQALDELAFVERACALDVEKVIRSAAANAYLEKGFRPEALVIEQAYVNEGPTIKRFRPRAKGAASRINKRTCHITVSVSARKEA